MRIPWKAVKRIGFLGLVSYLLISLLLNKILGWSFPDPKVSVVDQEAEIDYRVSDLGSVSLNMIGEKVAAKVYDTAVKQRDLISISVLLFGLEKELKREVDVFKANDDGVVKLTPYMKWTDQLPNCEGAINLIDLEQIRGQGRSDFIRLNAGMFLAKLEQLDPSYFNAIYDLNIPDDSGPKAWLLDGTNVQETSAPGPAIEQEKSFVNDLAKARIAFSDHNIDNAEELWTKASQLKPNDYRLNDLKGPLATAESDLEIQHRKDQLARIVKSFEDSIQGGNVTNALAEFQQAKALSPDDPSLPSLQSQLDDLKNKIFQGIDAKLTALDVEGADKDCADLAAAFPDESRLAEYKAKVEKARFEATKKAFAQAIESQDMDAAAAWLNEASALIPSEPSLAQLQSELNELKFKKGSSAFKDSVVNSHFDDAKKEFSQLQALNVEPEQTGALATQLAMGIKNAVSSAINRGKDALKSNNVDQAGEALAEASALDSANADVLAFEIQFGATGQWEQVVAMAQKAHDADPGNADAVHFLAVAQDGLDKQHRAMAASLLAQARDAAAKSDWNKADELSVASNQMTSTPEAIALAAHSQFMLLPVLKIETVSGHLGTAQADGTAVKVVGTYLPYPSSTGRYTWLEFMLNEGGTKFRLHAYFDPPLDKTSPVVAHLTQGARCEFTGMIGDVSGGPFRGQWAAPGPYLYNTELVAP